MADYSELVTALRWVIEQRVQKKFSFTRGLIGDGQGNIDVTDRANFSYVRPDRGRADYVEMFNKLANTAVDGTPILIGHLPWQPNLTQVLGVDWEAFMTVGWNAAFGGLAAHGQSHAWLDGREPEADYFDIHFRQILPLRTYPVGSGTPSVNVATWGTEYSGTFVTWPGEPGLDLSNAVPPSTGMMREMLVFWDVGLNQISAMTGTLSYSVTTTPPRPVLSSTGSFIPSGYVRLQGGQQSVTNTDIFDARQFLSTASLAGGIGVSEAAGTGFLTEADGSGFFLLAGETSEAKHFGADYVGYGSITGTNETLRIDTSLGKIETSGPVNVTGTFTAVTKAGIGTSTIPHESVGSAKFAIEGANVSTATGPHIQATTDSDDYPLFQLLPWQHDDINLSFDAYYDGDWRSGDTTSNFQISKEGDKLRIRYDSGIAQGSILTWNDAFVLLISGQIGMGSSLPSALDGTVHIHTASAGTVSASTAADELVLENDGSAGMHILSPDNFKSSVYFGSPTDSIAAYMEWDYGAAGANRLLTIGSLTTSGKVSIVSGINTEAIRIDENQNIGIGTATIPHGSIGAAKFAIEGTDASTAGPHIQLTTASDDYPLFQVLAWRHDVVSLSLDAYYDGDWRSSDVGSNFQIRKGSDILRFRYDSAIAQGGVITWNEGIALNISGQVGVGIVTPDGTMHVHTATAGSVTAHADADDLTIENSGNVGATLLSPDASKSTVYFGSPSDSIGAQIVWDYGTSGANQLMTIGTVSASGQVSIVAGNNSEAIRISSIGKVGIDTSVIPHGGIGAAKLAIDGAQSSTIGPHIQTTTTNDDYPIFQFYSFSHDSAYISFDAYNDGFWRSGDAGSNFQIAKNTDKLFVRYDSGVAQGVSLTWNDGITLDTSGFVGLGVSSPQGLFHTYDSISGFIVWEYDGLDATVRTVIPNGTGDVLYQLTGMYVLRNSAGAVSSGSTNVANSASVNLTVGADTVRLRVNANGSCDVARTAGTNTIKVALVLRWL